MSDFSKAFKKFNHLEYSNESNVLHKNTKESGMTFYGIYESAHPLWSGWENVYMALQRTDNNFSLASKLLIKERALILNVEKFYMDNFWNPLRLKLINSQKIAEEMFFFFINSGNKKRTIKMAQLIVGAVPDGFIGIETITKLNEIDENIFDRAYDLKEMEYHARLIQANPKRYLLNLVGWIRRDVYI